MDDPSGPEVGEATRTEKAAVDALGVPDERSDEVETWTVAHHALADFFVDSASDDRISTEEAAQLQQRSLDLTSMSEALGLTGCIGDGA